MEKSDGAERGIRCPRCKSPESLVYDSRKQKNFSVMRRRECKNCGFRYMTEETLYGYEFNRDDKEVKQRKAAEHGENR